jgi:hypothetical protein
VGRRCSGRRVQGREAHATSARLKGKIDGQKDN